jgi:hypothetical protein
MRSRSAERAERLETSLFSHRGQDMGPVQRFGPGAERGLLVMGKLIDLVEGK